MMKLYIILFYANSVCTNYDFLKWNKTYCKNFESKKIFEFKKFESTKKLPKRLNLPNRI